MDNTFEIRDEEIDVEEIMRKIRENIRMRREAGIYPEGEIEEISPTRASGSCHPDQIVGAGSGSGEIGLSPEARRDLNHINSTWDVENKGYSISSHRPVAGRFLIRGRELVHGEVRRYVDPAIWKQREFNASTTRVLNEVARGLEEIGGRLAKLEAALQEARSELCIETDLKVERSRFRQKEDFDVGLDRVVSDIESKIEILRSDVDVKTEDRLNRVVSEMNSHIEGMRYDLDSNIECMRSDLESHIDSKIEGMRSDLESHIIKLISDLDQSMKTDIRSTFAIMSEDIENKAWLAELLERKSKKIDTYISEKTNNINMNYFVFNDIYGGSDDEIRNNLSQYIKYFKLCKNVLDIGSGRGLFLDLLRENGIGSYGVDVNEDLVTYCKRKELDVVREDAISHLEKLSDRSLDGIFASHVIEHLSIENIIYLIDSCYKKLQYGSYAIFVMPNILNISVSSNLFYVDPTHITHVHPNVIKFLMNSSGFRELEEKYYYPLSEECKMKRIILNDSCDLKEATCLQHEQVNIINQNVDLLNNMLFGCRDYAIIGKK